MTEYTNRIRTTNHPWTRMIQQSTSKGKHRYVY